MRILHISNYYYPHIGGIEQVARDMVNALQQHEQRVICFNHEKGTVTEIVDGVPVTRVACQMKISSQSLAITYGCELKKQMREFNPEIVVLHFPNPFVTHFLMHYRHKNFKLIVYYHLDIYKQKILKLFFKGQTRHLLQWAGKIVVTSPNYIDGSQILPLFKDKCVVIPNCVNMARFNENIADKVKTIREQFPSKHLCFAVGRHVPYKGMAYLIQASQYLDESYQILIGGQGPLTTDLQKMAAGNPIVKFLGRVSDADLPAYYAACDVFCFPSITKNEAFGLAQAEAMSFGKPVVNFTIPGSGVNYVSLNQVTGLEVPNGNAIEFAAAIQKLATNPTLSKEYGANAKKRVQENFTVAQFQQNINQLVNN